MPISRRRIVTYFAILTMAMVAVMNSYTRKLSTVNIIKMNRRYLLFDTANGTVKGENGQNSLAGGIYANLKDFVSNSETNYLSKAKSNGLSVLDATRRKLQNITDYASDFFTDTNNEKKIGVKHRRNASPLTGKPKIRIVLYHIYHTLLKWSAKKLKMNKCYHSTNCEIRFQGQCSKDPIEAEAIVFQGNNMPRDRPVRLHQDQIFVYLNIESPQYLQNVRLSNPGLDHFFNWTMTYKRNSDIPYLYGSVLPRGVDKNEYLSRAEITGAFVNFESYEKTDLINKGTHPDLAGKNYEEIFRRKTKSSVWFVSHCSTASRREQYVSQMKKYTDIDIFGRCSNRTNTCPKNNPGCGSEIKDIYKFFIAFENSICEDYITEKVFRWFDEDIIVVVHGARYYGRYLPPGTYIDADSFASPKLLASYLTRLGSNETEYISYLKRKDHYLAISEIEHLQSAYCNLCYKLNNLNQYKKPAHNLYQWWNIGTCRRPNPLV